MRIFTGTYTESNFFALNPDAAMMLFRYELLRQDSPPSQPPLHYSPAALTHIIQMTAKFNARPTSHLPDAQVLMPRQKINIQLYTSRPM